MRLINTTPVIADAAEAAFEADDYIILSAGTRESLTVVKIEDALDPDENRGECDALVLIVSRKGQEREFYQVVDAPDPWAPVYAVRNGSLTFPTE